MAVGPDTGEIAMIALYPRSEEAQALAVEGGLAAGDLHVTLVFLGDAAELDVELVTASVARAVEDGAAGSLTGVIGGVGYFAAGPDGVPLILLPDVPNLTLVRERIVRTLRENGIESPSEHGFLPHLTQIYVESVDGAPPRENPIGQEIHFDAVSVVVGGRRQDYPLGGEEMSTSTVTVKIVPDFSEWDAEFQKRTGALAVALDVPPEHLVASVADVEAGQKWEGVLGFEGYPSDGDGGLKRFLMTPLGHRDLPLPLMAQFTNEEGHKKAGIAGRIDTIDRIPASEFANDAFDLPEDLPPDAFVHYGAGVFDTGEVGTEAARLVDAKMLRGVSVDLAGTQWVPLDSETFQEISQDEMSMERMLKGVLAGGKNSKIAGATIVAHPSFGHARIDLVACAFASAQIRLVHDEDLVACAAGPIAPPAEWFANPDLREPTPVTVTPEGQVFGHIATWDCHMGYENMCMTAKPSRDGYARFHTGTLITGDGTPVKIGRVSVAPHAPKQMTPDQVMAYFSDAKKVAAFVRLYEDRHGIACAGVTRSDAPRELLRDFLANPPSGEWRRGELLGISSVPLPGLPVVAPEAYFVASADGGDVTPEMLILPPVTEAEPSEDEVVFAAAAVAGPEAMLELIAGESFNEAGPWLDEMATYTVKQRRDYAAKGIAMRDGSFPIPTCSAARDAIHSQGRGGADQAKIVAHIRKRVRALNCSGGIFDDYK